LFQRVTTKKFLVQFINDHSIEDYNMLTLYTVTYIIIKNKKI